VGVEGCCADVRTLAAYISGAIQRDTDLLELILTIIVGEEGRVMEIFFVIGAT